MVSNSHPVVNQIAAAAAAPAAAIHNQAANDHPRRQTLAHRREIRRHIHETRCHTRQIRDPRRTPTRTATIPIKKPSGQARIARPFANKSYDVQPRTALDGHNGLQGSHSALLGPVPVQHPWRLGFGYGRRLTATVATRTNHQRISTIVRPWPIPSQSDGRYS
ncbi:hypothetical protein Arub01_19530 [Actinomadura rubrobrunea]|uniref:Uncharacterized protein n=1 Tax=Actinomadura rubrobrunea TaxID=115335 RepID=A0A9W6UUB4_9ACTN|nr:hypothetical protein Arub01_19530 [Actinomadura rubrobrunea]